jgi:hypothetical protein
VREVEFLKVFNYNHFSDQLPRKFGTRRKSRGEVARPLSTAWQNPFLAFGTLVSRLHDAAAPFSRIIGVAWNIS